MNLKIAYFTLSFFCLSGAAFAIEDGILQKRSILGLSLYKKAMNFVLSREREHRIAFAHSAIQNATSLVEQFHDSIRKLNPPLDSSISTVLLQHVQRAQRLGIEASNLAKRWDPKNYSQLLLRFEMDFLAAINQLLIQLSENPSDSPITQVQILQKAYQDPILISNLARHVNDLVLKEALCSEKIPRVPLEVRKEHIFSKPIQAQRLEDQLYLRSLVFDLCSFIEYKRLDHPANHLLREVLVQLGRFNAHEAFINAFLSEFKKSGLLNL